MEKIPCIAIFDIGKTNKKFILFDLAFQIVHEEQTNFEEVKDDEGENCEDLKMLSNWMLGTWKSIENDERFDIKALNFTTYGASFVHLNSHGAPATPLYSYLKPFPEDISEKFYSTYGDKIKIATDTASPFLGMLNSGLQIYWLKYKHPFTYKKIVSSLHFPQYCSYLFTGVKSAEFTSIGCHTALWDHAKNDYHDWVYKEQIDKLFSEIKKTHYCGNTTFRGKLIPVGTGLHDSSSALIPYLKDIKEKFLLLSTGTWCISLNPFAKQNLTSEELLKDCLAYLTFEGRQVKASRLFSGNDHENFTKIFSGHFYKDKDYYKYVNYDQQLVDMCDHLPLIIQDKYHPEIPFEAVNLDHFETYEMAYHKLIYDMVHLQKKSIFLAGENLEDHDRLYVDGGFSRNQIFMKLLAQVLPSLKVEAFEISQGTALGAAISMNVTEKALS